METTILGNYHELAVETAGQCSYPLSFLSGRWSDWQAWQAVGRAKVEEYLAYAPKACSLNARTDRKFERDGIVVEHVSYDQPFGPRTEGIMLYPARRSGKLPTVVALHDHGGFKYYGKEKLVEWDEEPELLTQFKRKHYEGRAWATELAKRGFAVFVPDVFLWGSRKMDPLQVPRSYVADVLAHKPNSDDYMRAYNRFAGEHESLVAKSLYLAGTTWTGIMAYEDRRAVDYVLTRPEVDGTRVGCGGLSGGGWRTIMLAALDPRISCAVCVGFMSTYREVVAAKINCHTWMLHVPHLSAALDLPDLLSLYGRRPVKEQYHEDDPLWTIRGQRDSDSKLRSIYDKLGASDQYCGRFYPGPHKFDIAMQEDAFDWFAKWLH